MSSGRGPELGSNLTLRSQRVVLVVALTVIAVLAAVLVPRATTFANSQNNAYQPFPCSTNGANQANRNSIGQIDNTGTKVFPCVSGAKWSFTAGYVGNVANQDYTQSLATVTNVKTAKNIAVRFAAGTSVTAQQLEFSSLVFKSTPYSQANPPVFGVLSGGVSGPKPKVPSTLSITPRIVGTGAGQNVVVGGAGVNTELLADPKGWFALKISDIIQLAGGGLYNIAWGLNGLNTICAAGSRVTATKYVFPYGNVPQEGVCRVQVDVLSGAYGSGIIDSLISAIVSALASGGTFEILSLNVPFYFMWTHTADASQDPYVVAPGGQSVQLPNVTVGVG